jgi:hypothetical protein
MTCHYSVLSDGHCPHPPHIHPEEELLIILDGAAELVIAASPDDAMPTIVPTTVGQVAYYPSGQHHTLRNNSGSPVTYLMFKWRARSWWRFLGDAILSARSRDHRLATGVYDVRSRLIEEHGRIFNSGRVFQATTRWLKNLHCHLTQIKAGGGYGSHSDIHDVAIALLEGDIEVNGYRLSQRGLLYFSGGELHDMYNPGEKTAKYLVFEFHR